MQITFNTTHQIIQQRTNCVLRWWLMCPRTRTYDLIKQKHGRAIYEQRSSIHTMYIRNMYVFANNVIKISHLEWLVNFWCINPKDDDVKRCDDAHELYPSKWLLSFKNMSAECEIKRTREMTNGGAEWWSGGRCGVWRNWIEGSFLSERNKKGVQGEHHYHHYHHHEYRISELMFYV